MERARSEIQRRFPTDRGQHDNENRRDKVFAFADVNSNLLIRAGEDTFPFNTDDDLDKILDEVQDK